MKKLIIPLLILCCQFCYGQKFKEWFQQKKTQKQYLIEQIAELKIYLEITKDGYQIAKQGLTTIGQIKESEFTMHKNRFDSLRIVNPKIASSKHLKQITDLHGKINQICEHLPDELSKTSVYNDVQLAYIRKVMLLLYDDSQSVMRNLLLVIRDQNLTMADDERINRVELCFQQMQSNYIFASSFQENALVLAGQVKTEKSQIQNSRLINGIN